MVHMNHSLASRAEKCAKGSPASYAEQGDAAQTLCRFDGRCTLSRQKEVIRSSTGWSHRGRRVPPSMRRSRASVAILLGCVAVALVLLALFQILSAGKVRGEPSHSVLDPENYHHYFVQFSSDEKAMLGEGDPLQWEWFEQNIPWLDVPDKQMEEIYYFRWYSFQKHIQTNFSRLCN